MNRRELVVSSVAAAGALTIAGFPARAAIAIPLVYPIVVTGSKGLVWSVPVALGGRAVRWQLEYEVEILYYGDSKGWLKQRVDQHEPAGNSYVILSLPVISYPGAPLTVSKLRVLDPMRITLPDGRVEHLHPAMNEDGQLWLV